MLAGRISVAGQFQAGIRLPLFAGPKRTGLKRSGSTNATKATGAFTAIKRMVRTTYYQVRFAIPAVVQPQLCARCHRNRAAALRDVDGGRLHRPQQHRQGHLQEVTRPERDAVRERGTSPALSMLGPWPPSA